MLLIVTITIGFAPTIAHLGPFQLGWHGIFTALAIAIAVATGIHLMEHVAAARGFSSEPLEPLGLWVVIGGVVGARLFHVLDHLSAYLAHPLTVLEVWNGGIAVYGGFVGGLAAGLLAVRRSRLPAWPLLDAAAPAMLIGQAIGRLGCLSNGDAWGAPCSSGLGLCIVYANPADQLPASLLGVPTHAYPVYEIAAVLALLLIAWLTRHRLCWLAAVMPGAIFLLAAIAYAAIRFGLTFFRQEAIVIGGLQEAQVIALLTGSGALALLAARLLAALGPGSPPGARLSPPSPEANGS
jgi:phosphatidylglycerol:prolipoprotein diacylglycerol transferase